jgi:hypothetical protein
MDEQQTEQGEHEPVLDRTIKQTIDMEEGRGLVLRNLSDLWRYATCYVNSGVAQQGLRRPEAVVVICQYGAEVFGWGPQTSLQTLKIIKGHIGIPAKEQRQLILASGTVEYIKERFVGDEIADAAGIERYPDDFAAVCRAKRKGQKTVAEWRFSVADAKQAGLWNKRYSSGEPSSWVTHPKLMLAYRAWGVVADRLWSDVTHGLKMAEELQDYPVQEQRLESGDTIPAEDMDEIANQVEQELAAAIEPATMP